MSVLCLLTHVTPAAVFATLHGRLLDCSHLLLQLL